MPAHEVFSAWMQAPPLPPASFAMIQLTPCKRSKDWSDWSDLLDESKNMPDVISGGTNGPVSHGDSPKKATSVVPCTPNKERKMTKEPSTPDQHPGLRTPKTPLRLPCLPCLPCSPSDSGSDSGSDFAVTALNVCAVTPKAMTRQWTPEVDMSPPPGPADFQKRLSDDIEVAVQEGSTTLLSLALLRDHGCGDDHSVHEAVRRNHVKALQLLLLNTSATQADAHCHGRRPLHSAIQHCISEDDVGYKMLEALLSAGASANFCEGDDPSLGAPLHMAAKRRCIAVVALLLAYGAKPNVQDAGGRTPLHMSCHQLAFQTGFVEEKVTDLLLSYGACPVVADSLDHEPVDYAHDVVLRRKLQKAAQWWARSQLELAVGRRAAPDGEAQISKGCEEERVQEVPWLLPEIFEAVAGCL